jgi:hypothetical protein
MFAQFPPEVSQRSHGSPDTMERTNIRGRHGFDVVGSPAELQAEVSGRPR